MRRKIKHTKRYKDYSKNVPKKLLKEFFQLDCSISKLALQLMINSGTLSQFINDGVEPKDMTIRLKLGLKSYPICPTCKRKISIHKRSTQKKDQPEHIKKWKHLSTDERNKVIEQYIRYKNSKLTIH